MHLFLRPVRAIVSQIEALKVNRDNLLSAMAAVRSIEKLEIGKEVAADLESRCVEFSSKNFTSALDVSKFVTDNCENNDLVIRLLLKCESSLTTSAYNSSCKDHPYSCGKCKMDFEDCLICNDFQIFCSSDCRQNFKDVDTDSDTEDDD